MKYVKLFENFTEEEDLDFLNNVKDILLEYAEKYDWANLIETYDHEMEEVVEAQKANRPFKESGLII